MTPCSSLEAAARFRLGAMVAMAAVERQRRQAGPAQRNSSAELIDDTTAREREAKASAWTRFSPIVVPASRKSKGDSLLRLFGCPVRLLSAMEKGERNAAPKHACNASRGTTIIKKMTD